MKSICITGSEQVHLDYCATYIELSGATKAVSAKRGEEISIETWHKKVSKISKPKRAGTLDAISIGRVWDQIAGDIFFANHDELLWYWADTRSLPLLDYWQKFDPNTHFVLVHTSLRELIVNAIKSGNTAFEHLQSIIERWHHETLVKLNFHLHHKKKSVILNFSDFASDKSHYLSEISNQLQLSFKPIEEEKLLAPETSKTSAIALFLSDELIKSFPESFALETEVNSILLNSSSISGNGGAVAIEAVIGAYSESIISNKKNQTTLADTLKSNEILDLKIKELELQNERLNIEKAALNSEISNIELNKITNLENELKAKAVELDDAANKVRELDAKLGSLEAEHSSLKLVSLQNTEEDNVEKNLVFEALHHTQEMLETKLKLSEHLNCELKRASERIEKLLKAYPNYWDCDNYESQTIANESETFSNWSFSNLFINGQFLSELRFKLVLRNGVAGIVFQREVATSSPLQRWPEDIQYSYELPCVPARGPMSLEANNILSNLGSTDWQTLRTLVGILIEIYSVPRTPDQKYDDLGGLAIKGLVALQKTLDKWPRVIRFDCIEAEKIHHGEHYHSLSIKFKNLSLGEKLLGHFNYRISTVDETDAAFGQNPRLEFPKSTSAIFESWFPESTDDRGERLELRFAAPAAMDTRVWEKLSDADKILIAGLVGSAPAQINELSQLKPEQSQRWDDWSTLATTIKTIVIKSAGTGVRKKDMQK